MTFRHTFIQLCTITLLLGGTWASASDIGQEIADQVTVDSYRHYLDDELYTHDGHNRGVGGAHHNLARDFIRAELESFGLEVEFHEFTAWGTPGWNVVATQVGTVYPDAHYIIGSHYDSVDNPGADDNASGVAAILEIARILSQYETEYTVKYIAFDIEEWGLIGSSAYVDDHISDDIRGMFSLDMIAWNGYARAFEIWGRPASEPLKTAMVDAINEYGNGLEIRIMGTSYGSNHAPFESAGFEACELIEAGHSANPCYHQMCDSVDTPGYIDHEFAADLARSVAGFLADTAVAAQPCVGDLDGDGEIGLADLAILLAHYDITSGMTYADGDLDGDEDVDLADLATLLSVYGTPCP